MVSVRDIYSAPKPIKITGRSSSITNAFANSIIPVIEPTDQEISKALMVLGMTVETICCSYCGDKHTEWDHLRPLIKDKRPTGYVTEINNLVPSCGKCNQSKGNKHWRDWITGSAKLSPLTRNVPQLDEKIARLEDYEQIGAVQKIDFEEVLGTTLWREHWDNWQLIMNNLETSQSLAKKLKQLLAEK